MEQKALNKGVSRQLQSLELVAFFPIAVGEADLAISDLDKAARCAAYGC
jgi:hypothetical protein